MKDKCCWTCKNLKNLILDEFDSLQWCKKKKKFLNFYESNSQHEECYDNLHVNNAVDSSEQEDH